MISESTQIAAVFVILAIVLWYGTRFIIDSTPAQIGILLLVGVIIPMLLNAYLDNNGNSERNESNRYDSD